jgi:pimeloyl-ACP methyl ester carboxylesterase
MSVLNRFLTVVFVVMSFAAGPLLAQDGKWRIAVSSDNVPIAYMASGKGPVTLVFVHGWSCDTRYWQEQIPYFAKKYQVVSVDLAGHGHSGFGRPDYTMPLFGQDVKAVVDAVGAKRVILIGHSMGGVVIGEAAVLMPDRVVGLIGIDTIENVEQTFTQAELDGYTASFQKDFPAAVKPFIQSMLVKDTDPILSSWIIEDVAAAPQTVAVSALKNMFGMYVSGDIGKLFDQVSAPVRCINTDMWPINYEANRRHMRSFEAKIIKGRGHFLMLERPKEFNQLLEETVIELNKK